MSEPIFEASVRLRADVGDFEAQAKASLQRSTQQLEQQTQQAVRAAQQAAAVAPPVVVAGGGAPPTDLERQLAQARALAAQPLQIEVIANTEPFDREVNAAYRNVTALAEQNLAKLEQTATATAEAVSSATTTLTETKGFEARAQAQAALELAQQADRVASQAASEARLQLADIRSEAQEALLRPAAELQTQATTAGTRAQTAEITGDVAGQVAQQLQLEILGRQAALEGLKLQQQEFAQQLASASGVEREALLASAEQAAAAAGVLRREIVQLQTTGRLPVAPGAAPPGGQGGGGFLDSITGPGGLLRSRSGSSSLTGILGTTARFGLAGLAFGAAFSTLNELQQALKVTGQEAYTTEGRIRNLGAELLSGNLIGGIKAVIAQEPAKLTEGLDAAVAATKELEARQISLTQVLSLQNFQGASTQPDRPGGPTFFQVLNQGLLKSISEGRRTSAAEAFRGEADAIDGASDSLKDYLAAQVRSGAISKENALAIAKTTVELQRQADAAFKAATEWKSLTDAATVGREAQDQFGRRGPGVFQADQGVFRPGEGPVGAVVGQQRTGIPRPIITNPFENPTNAEVTGVAARVRDSMTQRIQNEGERLQADLQSAKIAEKGARATFESAKAAARTNHEINGAADEFEKVVAATTRTANAAAAVREHAQQAAEEMQAASDRIANARIAGISDPDAQLRAQLAQDQATQARESGELEKAKAAYAKKKISALELRQAEAEYAEAVAATQVTQNQISGNAKAAAEAAQQDARNAEELRLANNIAAAALTKRKSDDKKFYNEAIDYYRAQARDASLTATEREQARGTVRELRQGLRTALAGGGAELQQQQLQNALAQAQQVGSIPLQRRAAQRLVDFWEGQVKAATGIEKAQAQASLIGARGQLQAVEGSATDLQEQRIRNRISAAQLTKGLDDDKKAADALVTFWKEQVKHAQGIEKERARSNLISARLARQALDQQQEGTGGTGFGTVDFLKVSQSIMRDFAGNLLPTGGLEQARSLFAPVSPEDLASGGKKLSDLAQIKLDQLEGPDITGARAQADNLAQTGQDQLSELRQIRNLLERNGTGATVHVNQTMRTPDQTGFAQARYAKLAMEDAFNG